MLITVAAVPFESGLRENFEGQYKLRLTDVQTPADLGAGEEFIEADIRDFDAVAES